MNGFRVVLILACVLASITTVRTDRQGEPGDRLFAVRFQPGSAWDKSKTPGEQTGFAAHSANLQRLRREGALVLGGRFADVGLIVVKASDATAARALFAADATITAGVFAMQIDPWSTIFDGCTPGAAKSAAHVIGESGIE